MQNFTPNVLQGYNPATGILCTISTIPDIRLKSKTAANLLAHSITTMTAPSSYRSRCNFSRCNR